jgi:hypothetical protein
MLTLSCFIVDNVLVADRSGKRDVVVTSLTQRATFYYILRDC